MTFCNSLNRLEFPLDFYWVRRSFLKPIKSRVAGNPLHLHGIFDTLSLLLSQRDAMYL